MASNSKQMADGSRKSEIWRRQGNQHMLNGLQVWKYPKIFTVEVSRYLCLPNSPQRTLPSSSSSAISWHQQFKSAIWISSWHQQWVGCSHKQTPKNKSQVMEWLHGPKQHEGGQELHRWRIELYNYLHYLYQRSVDISLSISSKLRLQPMHVQATGVPPWQIVNMWERHTANELNQTNCTNPNTQGNTNTHQPNQ